MNKYLEILEKTENSLMIYKEGELIFESDLKGIRPHLKAINEHGSELEGTLMVDKILGRAAAFLMIYSKAGEAITAVLSTPGKQVLDKYGLKYSYSEEVPHIKLENGVIYCPFERMVQGIEDPNEAYEAIVEKMNSFKTSSS
ncbi:MAG: DUF1893 domain-containing protein [Candidatus Bathyarchaeota archaeon]|nr:DUF1893 domain-containing protein [Candidatus Bathyarchaeota archaeon]